MRGGSMQVIFLFPLAFAFFGAIFILINDDFGRVAKSVAVLLAGGSIALLFTPVHFLVPLAICIWLALYFQMNRDGAPDEECQRPGCIGAPSDSW